MILLIDNYDSFAHNLGRYFQRLGQKVLVVRNDQVTALQVQQMVDRQEIHGIVISPGPGDPDSAGVCLELVERFYRQLPILGVCLGHQVIVQAFGGRVLQWNRPIHGMADEVFHQKESVFRSIPSPFLVGRYHSLVADQAAVPDCLAVTARLSDQTIMAVEHREWPVVGIQFHPESILTQFGPHLLEEFLKKARLSAPLFSKIALLKLSDVRGPVAMMTLSHSSGGRPGISPRSMLMRS